MNRLESFLSCVIIFLLFVIVGAGRHVYDIHQENMNQRVELYKYCFPQYGKACEF